MTATQQAEPGAGNRVHQESETQHAWNQVQDPSGESSHKQ